MILYFVRHGESEGNRLRIATGWTDVPLSARGEEQARAAAEKLKEVSFSACYTSELKRAYTTAEICAAGRGIPVVRDIRLNEQFLGAFENRSMDEMIENDPAFRLFLDDWSLNPPPGGERFDALCSRVRAALDEMIAKGEDALIAAHYNVIATALVCLLNLPPAFCNSFSVGQGTYSAVSIRARRNKLMIFNR